MGRRREPRIARALTVRVWGLDRDGNRFMVDARTVDISRTGARLEGVRNVKGPGDIIEVRHGKEKTPFQIVWVGQAGTPEAGQIGIRSLEPAKSIWGAELPAAAPDDYQAAQPEENSARETGAPMGVTQSGSGPERRRYARYACRGQARMLPEASDVWLMGVLVDISLGGCYAEMMSPLPSHSQIQLELRLDEVLVRTKGRVVVSTDGMGMGIAFTEMTAEYQQILQHLVAQVAGGQKAGPGTEPQAQPRETRKENRPVAPPSAATSETIPSASDLEVVLESLFKLLERKAVLSRREYVELMKILKSLDR